MWTLIKIAWRNLFRQRRRTAITVSAMAISLIVAIPYYGLVEGLSAEMLKGITKLELGHAQVHDPAYPRGRALQSTLRRPDRLLEAIRATPGVVAAGPRVHGNALASHDNTLAVVLRAPSAALAQAVRFGRPIKAEAPWRQDPALACEALVEVGPGRERAIAVGTVLTPAAATAGGACERVRIVGLVQLTRTTAPFAHKATPLNVYLHAEDMQQAFGQPEVSGQAVLRHSAAIALEGIDPTEEQKITFMAEKLVEGRYLAAEARDEVVIGYRLGRVMRVAVGDKLFVQAASLDNSSGSFYQDFTVVGIYRTGVDMIDRSRVFLHINDAQRIMALNQRVHEIALTGQNAKLTKPLVTALRKRLAEQTLTVAPGGTGLRAGSRALAAPVAVYEPADHGTELLIPYDLKRRFEDIAGLKQMARRVYAQTKVAAVPPTTAKADQTPANAPAAAPKPAKTLRVVGVETAIEPQLSGLPTMLARGGYFGTQSSDGDFDDDAMWPLLISARAATTLGIDLGDTLRLRARDADEQVRWQNGRVIGVLADAKWSTELPEIVLPYFTAQQIDAPKLNARAHEILLIPDKGTEVPTLIGAVSPGLAPLTRSWQQVAPDMAKLLQTQDAWIGVVLLIIFAIAAITVMNTMLMAVFERTKEFGVLKSVGMKPRQVFGLIIIETLAIATIALVVGGVCGTALNQYLMVHGLDLTRWTSGFTYQGTFVDPVWRSLVTIKTVAMPLIMVAFVCFGVSLYPAFRAGHIKPVEALRHQG